MSRPRPARIAGVIGVIALFGLAASFPFVDNNSAVIAQATEVTLYALVLLGLAVAVGYAGLLTLGAGALMGFGAYSAALLSTSGGLPLLVAIPLGTVIGAGLGMIVLAPALRLGRAAYAMVSLYAAYNFITATKIAALRPLTHGDTSLNGIPALVPISSAGSDDILQAQYAYLIVLAVTAVVMLLCWRLLTSHWGPALLAVRDDEISAAAMGTGTVRTRLLALAVCAICASLAGALAVSTSSSCVEVCSLAPGRFSLDFSIFLFSALVVGGRASLGGPVTGVVLLGIFYVFLAGNGSEAGLSRVIASGVIYGVLLLAVATLLPEGLWGSLKRVLGRVLAGRQASSAPDVATAAFQLTTVNTEPSVVVLSVDAVAVHYGGTIALDAVGLSCPAGRVHALVGANGSGKTSLLNVISGITKPSSGTVLLSGQDMAGRSPSQRARTGLARTFQTPRVIATLSVLDNVLMGGFSRHKVSLLGLYFTPWRYNSERRALRAEAVRLLGVVGLSHRGAISAGLLTHGERRLLEVARALMAQPRLLLLDEPAAGLAAAELHQLAALIGAASDSGCAVILVEHNLRFVRRVAQTATALDRGRVLADGPVDTVLARHDVVVCFVGEQVA